MIGRSVRRRHRASAAAADREVSSSAIGTQRQTSYEASRPPRERQWHCGSPGIERLPRAPRGSWCALRRGRAAGPRPVPPAAARKGSYISSGVVLMPSYVNIGAYVDGVILAVLVANLVSPLLDNIRPKALGKVK